MTTDQCSPNETLGQIIGDLRGSRGSLLRQSSGWSGVGYGIIELNRARSKEANKEQLHAIAAYYNINVDELLSAWSSDKMVDQVHNETLAKEALKKLTDSKGTSNKGKSIE